VFMQNFDAVIIVFDISKTDDLSSPGASWISELEKASSPRHGKISPSPSVLFDIEGGGGGSSSSGDGGYTSMSKMIDRQDSLDGFVPHSWIQGQEKAVPVMLVGNKIDLLTMSRLQQSQRQSSAEVEYTSTFDPNFNVKKFHSFFHFAYKRKVGDNPSLLTQSQRSTHGANIRKKTHSPSMWK
jgi:GTPase SAR1 family protein